MPSVLAIGSIIITWIIAITWHVIWENSNPLRSFYFWSSNLGQAPPLSFTSLDSLAPGEKTEHLFWFIHVSDLHINQFGKGLGLENFDYFLRNIVPTIDPLFVVATGDLTDAKESPGLCSKQFQAEWDSYKSLLQKSGYYDRNNFWFDLRGNHDCFDVPEWNSSQNYFSTHSKMRKSSYMHIFDLPFGKYGLIAIDGCPSIGPSRPFNFFGAMPTERMDIFQRQINELELKKVRHSIIMSHYPIVTMQFALTSDGTSILQLTKGRTAYLSGHLHRFIGNSGRELYARRENGMLDLELNDLKDHRIFRIGAFDHDMFSFVDNPMSNTPFILITNPKDSRFIIPHLEDSSIILRSTHIRVLIFSHEEIVSAEVKIGGKSFNLRRSKDLHPLFTAVWNPSDFINGIHNIVVTAIDASGNTNSVAQRFRIDGNADPINSLGEYIMLFHFELWVMYLYWFTYALLLILLIVPAAFKVYLCSKGAWRSQKILILKKHEDLFTSNSNKLSGRIVTIFLRLLSTTTLPFLLLVDHTYIWYSYLLFCLYIPFGPLIIAWLTPSSKTISIFTLWGIWRSDFGWTRFLDTWTCGTISLLSQFIPALFIISSLIYRRQINGHSSLSVRILHKSIVLIWWMICGFKNLALIRSYGLSALIGGIGFSWHFIYVTIMILFLWQRPSNVSTKSH